MTDDGVRPFPSLRDTKQEDSGGLPIDGPGGPAYSTMPYPYPYRIFVKRIYEGSDSADGYRVLIDRLWPRGLKKTEARIDLWMKEIAPSHELRSWFQHDPEKWAVFKQRYVKELDTHPDLIAVLIQRVQQGPLTFLYAAKNETQNHALVLEEYLLNLP